MSELQTTLEGLAGRVRGLIDSEPSHTRLRDRLRAPFRRAVGWRPALSTVAFDELLESLLQSELTERALQAAVDELACNVHELEQGKLVWGQVPTQRLRFAWSVARALSRAEYLHRKGRAGGFAARSLGEKYQLSTALQRVSGLNRAAAPGSQSAPPSPVQALVTAGLAEHQYLGRRRRLLEAAREVLLDTEAAATMPLDGAMELSDALARELSYVDRSVTLGLLPNVGLSYQMREALRRGEVDRAHAAAVALVRDGMDGEAFMQAMAGSEVLDRLTPADELDNARDRSMLASAHAHYGDPFRARVRASLDRAHKNALKQQKKRKKRERQGMSQRRAAALVDQTDPRALGFILRGGASAGARFELGQSGSSVQIEEREVRVRTGIEPSTRMRLTEARDVTDLPRALITDPRSVLFDLAAGRLLTRVYEQRQEQLKTRHVLMGEVRMYCLDASSSMWGPRAFMRDAIILNELRSLEERLRDPTRHLEPVLFYRYFTQHVGPVKRIDTADAVPAAIADVIGTERAGETDIQGALLSCYQVIAEAQDDDRQLARAQIVLVTDGESPVDEIALWKARTAVGTLPVGLSVIALGEENAALRSTVARQRAQGEKAFYQYLTDAQIAGLLEGTSLAALPLHAPEDIDQASLVKDLMTAADNLISGEGAVDAEGMQTAAHLAEAIEEVEALLDLPAFDQLVTAGDDAQSSPGALAGLQGLQQSHEALKRRFDHYFPPPAAPTPDRAAPSPARPRRAVDMEHLVTLVMALEAVADVVELVKTGTPTDLSDTIEITERITLEAGIGPWRYDELLARYPSQFRAALDRIRAAARR